MKLNFLWHMHQPDYRDASGIMQLPWVVLHALKDYYDMPWMMARVQGMKATFNVTPSLIKQLQLYSKDILLYDRFLSLWILEPYSLAEEDKVWLIKTCKSSNYENMVLPLDRYKELYDQESYTHAELIELEVLFLLSWCGNYLRQNDQNIQKLLFKQREYTQYDKEVLIKTLQDFMREIFPYYKELHAVGLITISTTPLNHPILPLLMDMNNALSAHPMTNIPANHIPLEDDALSQVQEARELFADVFGFMPSGFWPAEGAVDPKSVALLHSQSVEWIATDEAILFRSLETNEKKALYNLYDYKGMKICFRDHYLSDLIGFAYRHKEANEAVTDFILKLQQIQIAQSDALVSVILDGENAWEFYKSNGYDFFEALYTKLSSLTWCQTLTMDEVKNLEPKELQKLAPGSWIHGEFNTWVGHKEKTRGWELLFMTKHDYDHHKDTIDLSKEESIKEHFLAAECSDWFWWYGDDHYSEYAIEFDALFRSHLIAIYDLMGITPPTDLFMAIIEHKSAQDFWLLPKSDISPNINGKHDSFFEWIGCGVVDETKVFSTMDMERGPVKRILYGQDQQKLYFSFEADKSALCENNSLEIIIEPQGIRGKLNFPDQGIVMDEVKVYSVCSDLLELSIEKEKLDSKEVLIRFEIAQGEKVIQILPSFGELKIELDDDYSREWFV